MYLAAWPEKEKPWRNHEKPRDLVSADKPLLVHVVSATGIHLRAPRLFQGMLVPRRVSADAMSLLALLELLAIAGVHLSVKSIA